MVAMKRQNDFYDDYNQPAASLYSKEEWFVPARYSKDTTYWSRSYYDIYSKTRHGNLHIARVQWKIFHGSNYG